MPGSHSTAVRRVEGKVAAAEKGTLFLDEIGDLAARRRRRSCCSSCSRGSTIPLGGTRAETADVRVIAATNVDLNAAVAEHRFREDLFYRLQVLPLRMPSLAERRDDIPELAAYFADAASDRHGLPKLELSHNAIRAAELADWPGNVRQLAHAMEAAADPRQRRRGAAHRAAAPLSRHGRRRARRRLDDDLPGGDAPLPGAHPARGARREQLERRRRSRSGSTSRARTSTR